MHAANRHGGLTKEEISFRCSPRPRDMSDADAARWATMKIERRASTTIERFLRFALASRESEDQRRFGLSEVARDSVAAGE